MHEPSLLRQALLASKRSSGDRLIIAFRLAYHVEKRNPRCLAPRCAAANRPLSLSIMANDLA